MSCLGLYSSINKLLWDIHQEHYQRHHHIGGSKGIISAVLLPARS